MWQWPIAALLGVGLAIFINTRGEDFSATQVTDAQALAITQTHCAGCHAASPTHPAFKAPPAGIILDSLIALEQHSDKVMAQAVLSQAMPLGNATHMTAKERAKLGAWLADR